ncbi:MAG: peptidoglycan D,D-transpeptidase FtsI [Candidatus Pelagadaptatus aseana]|uniref:peptidoglycan D,D-transpeptidase FtsI family protein n=1 Tax=Candidatus Pelagadaptatus aseana TaxID=3120508 RepID=UPI0039B2B578
MKNNKAAETVTVPRWRFALVLVLLCALVLLLLWHVALLQVVPGKDRGFEFLQGQGNARTVRIEGLAAHRGVITDRNGEPLAVSTPLQTLWLNPQEWSGSVADLQALAGQLGVERDSLANKIAQYASREFMYLKRNMAPDQAQQILAQRLPGVYGRREYQRFYPAGEVAAHVVGFTNIDDKGQEGLELAFDEWLQGQAGSKRLIKDLKGHVIKDAGLVQAPKPGQDIRLSIDLRMQYVAHRELKRAVAEHSAAAGSVVLLDVKTGEVLAMANQPAYNPNDRARIRVASLRNRAITDQFEPGSTMKPLTVMAALETGRYRPGTVIDTSPGYIHIDNKTLLDPINYGKIDLTKVITKSSQVGISKLALDLELDTIRDIYFRMGLGQGTAIGFPGERIGVLPNKSRWTRIERANFAFGYGMSVTPLQLAQAYAVIANHGMRKPVSLLRHDEPVPGERVVSARVSRQIIDMLKTVVLPGGTGKQAQIASYPVAGKTGTAHKVTAEGYADDQYISIFAGMAPAEAPRVVAVVVVDDPKSGKYYGGEVAAPVFSRVAESALRLMNVPPQISVAAATGRPWT